MKDGKAKYLIIDSIDIYKQLYNFEREFAFNDFFNVYTPDRVANAKEFFDKYNVPKEIQKIIVKTNGSLFMRNMAEEYIMGFKFDMKAKEVYKKNSDKYISMSNLPILYDGQVFRDKIKFQTELKYYKFDEIINFLFQIDECGYLELYLKAIKEFFDMKIDLDELSKVWNQEQNVLKLYRKKYPQK